MADIWFTSDTHMGHENILKFKRDDGSPLRDFANLDLMHERICDEWQSVVRPQDKIYHLGDVAMGPRGKEGLALIKGLNGHKRLLLGNHDDYGIPAYLEVFKEIHASRRIDGILFSHIPIVLTGEGGKIKGCVHGHYHYNPSPPGPYLNISVECTDYKPVCFDWIKLQVSKMPQRKSPPLSVWESGLLEVTV